MSTDTQPAFSELLKQFVKDQKRAWTDPRSKIILIIMANTHDHTLAESCEQDVKAVRKVFKHIAEHSHYLYCEIEISGNNYSRENLRAAINKIDPFVNDISIFYYTGHGFSYDKDKSRKYPQIDLRTPGNQVEYNDMDFIRKNTRNLQEILQRMRLKGGRINIAIGDCCNSNIHRKRTSSSTIDLEVVEEVMAPVSKSMTKKLFMNEFEFIDIVVSATQPGQSAVADRKKGSIFTYNFTRALAEAVSGEPDDDQYLPWPRLLKKSAEMASKEAKQYDIGGGTPGQQTAIFEIFSEKIVVDTEQGIVYAEKGSPMRVLKTRNHRN